ncbi:hypothetical protein [Tissierella praeacuta]|uniref:hypothetical protein n=1 Tax=Tissierella praeacuta TaxID=43131 RepID=UPI003340F5C0
MTDKMSKKSKIILIILLTFYLVYFSIVIFGMSLFHSRISLYSITGVSLPFICFAFIIYGLFRTSDLTNKKYIYISLILTLLPMIVSFGLLGLNEFGSKFNHKRWIAEKEKRVWMVDDLLRNHEIIGMDKNDIVELLGEPSDTEYFKELDNIVYYLGPERGLIRIDSEWLAIWFDEKNIVTEFKIMRD